MTQKDSVRNICLVVFLFLSLLFLSPFCALSAQSAETGNTLSSSDEAAIQDDTPSSQRLDKIGKAGENFGQRIDGLSRIAASHMGDWVNTSVFAGITWLKLFACLVMVFFVVVVERIMRWFLFKKAGTPPTADTPAAWQSIVLHAASKPLSLFVWVYGVYLSVSPLFPHFQSLDGSNLLRTIAATAADFGGTFAVIWLIYRLVDLLDARLLSWSGRTKNAIDDMLMPLVGRSLRIFIMVIGALILIQNATGIEIGPLLASLGIGGLAVALAAKDSIANLFGTLTILFDKPFRIGDRIIIDKYDGVVEQVGFRSTRIRTLTGHLVSIPNEKVVNTGLENIAKRPNIRWLNNIGITYDTPPEKAERAVEIIREILDNHEGFHPDLPPRVFFNGFNDWSLNILVLAWYHPPEYWDFQAWVQRTCVSIMKRFREEGIDFAFPSQTLYMANDDKRQLKIETISRNTTSPS